jgi:hypothetical protein
MATYTKAKFSGSTNGKGVQVAATASTGTTIHTAVSGTTSWDEIWMWAINQDTADRTLTIEYGDVGAANEIKVVVPPTSGLMQTLPGIILNNAKIVTAYASVTNKITLFGYVNQIV